MRIFLNYITYRNCPLEIREKLSLCQEDIDFFFSEARDCVQISEFTVLQTCNRLEFYGYCADDFNFADFICACMKEVKADYDVKWTFFSSLKADKSAVRHLFKVSAGLESQVLGENQVLSQVKAAYTLSIDYNMSSLIFHKLFHHAFRAGKAVRTHTDINRGAVSVSKAAIELVAEEVDIERCKVVMIGAGENARLTAGYLLEAGLKNITVANRHVDKAEVISSQFENGKSVGICDIEKSITGADLVVSSTGSCEKIITAKSGKILESMGRGLVMVDLAVPRDIDPIIGELENVTLYNIEDIDRKVNDNLGHRQNQIPAAERIVMEFTNKFEHWLSSLDLRPTIKRLTHSTLTLARAEAKRYAGDFGPENEEKLTAFAESLARKFLHKPLIYLKSNSENSGSDEQPPALDVVSNMFLSQDDHK